MNCHKGSGGLMRCWPLVLDPGLLAEAAGWGMRDFRQRSPRKSRRPPGASATHNSLASPFAARARALYILARRPAGPPHALGGLVESIPNLAKMSRTLDGLVAINPKSC